MKPRVVTIAAVIVANQDEILKHPIDHPILGEFIDAGTHAFVREVPPGIDGLKQMLGTALEKASSNIQFRRIPPYLATPGIQVLREPALEENAKQSLNSWYEQLARGSIFSFIVVDIGKRLAPLWILFGYGLPSRGRIPPVAVEDVYATWVLLAGGKLSRGRYLLEDSQTGLEPDDEAILIERLRQLYGE